MATTKIYRNTNDQPVSVLGVGDIAPGDQISITSDYHQPVVLANYPGVVEVTELEDQGLPVPPLTYAQDDAGTPVAPVVTPTDTTSNGGTN